MFALYLNSQHVYKYSRYESLTGAATVTGRWGGLSKTISGMKNWSNPGPSSYSSGPKGSPTSSSDRRYCTGCKKWDFSLLPHFKPQRASFILSHTGNGGFGYSQSLHNFARGQWWEYGPDVCYIITPWGNLKRKSELLNMQRHIKLIQRGKKNRHSCCSFW